MVIALKAYWLAAWLNLLQQAFALPGSATLLVYHLPSSASSNIHSTISILLAVRVSNWHTELADKTYNTHFSNFFASLSNGGFIDLALLGIYKRLYKMTDI